MAAVETPREVKAQAKYVKSSARKARLVADAIRDRSVAEARTILAFTQKDVARDFEKVLKSAVSNAEANHGLDGDTLVLAAVYADEGPTLKRFRPRARGRAGRIFKRTCHITIKLDRLEDVTVQGGRGAQKKSRARKGGTAGGATAARPKTRKKKEAAV
jgi:ribosomal protein L22